MATAKTTYDVFLSHSHRDTAFARQIAETLQAYDLNVFFDADEVALGDKYEEVVWEAMADSGALVTIIPEGPASSWMAIEMGAAKAWNKPVYAIAAKPEDARSLSAFHNVQIFPPSRADEIAIQVKRSLESLGEEETQALKAAYERVGVTVDRLASQPKDLGRLVELYTKTTGVVVSGERLLWMLMRLRKQGQLPKTRKSGPKKS